MKIVQVPPQSLKPGEIIAENVYSNKRLLVEKETVLTKEGVDTINSSAVTQVVIYMTPTREVPLLKPDEAIVKGLQFGAAGYLDVAESCFGFALRRQPKNLEANLYRGVTLFFSKKFDLARNRFKTTLVIVNVNQKIPQPDDTRNYDRLRKRLASYVEQCEENLHGRGVIKKIKLMLGLAIDLPMHFTDSDDAITAPHLNDYDISCLKKYSLIPEV